MTEQSWQTSWAREADKVKELSENNAHLRAALVKAEEEVNEANERAHHHMLSRTAMREERDTWRARAEALSTTHTTGGCNCSSRKDCPVHAPMYVAPPPPPLRKPDTENGR